MPDRHHLLQHIRHVRSLDLVHQTLHQMMADCNVDRVLLETHLGNLLTSVLLTFGKRTPEDDFDSTLEH